MEIECKKHGKSRAYHPSGRNPRCSACATEAVSKRRRALKEKAIALKGGKCSICGYNKSKNSLVFHHLDPKEKEFGLSHRGITRSWAKVQKEIEKCILICANCHGEIHEII